MTNAQDNLNLFKEMSISGFETLRSLGALNLQTWEKFADRQMDAVNLLVEAGTQEIKLVSETKDVNALVNGQVELAKQFGETLMSKSRENLDVVAEVQEEYRTWFENGVNAISSKAAESVGKSA
jgi:phasin family protein